MVLVLTRPALNVGVSLIARQALATHALERERLHHSALGIVSTYVGGAGVLALEVYASQAHLTLLVASTRRLIRPITFNVGIALVACWTLAHSLVVLRMAHGTIGTLGLCTHVDALILLAKVVFRTVRVCFTPTRGTPDEGVAPQARWTATSGLVLMSEAFCVGGARVVNDARLFALLVVAGKGVRAVVAILASYY